MVDGINSAGKGSRILFIEKVFLKGRAASLRGVELFNVQLLRDFLGAGIESWVMCHPAWATVLKAAAGLSALQCLTVRGGAFGGAARLIALPPKAPDAVVLGNVGSGIIPIVRVLRLRYPRVPVVLIAHRMPSPRFLSILRGSIDRVVSVNGPIAEAFLRAGYPHAEVYYGVTRADRFFPRAQSGAKIDGTIDVCLMGQLDNAWKGSDTAIEAFRALKPELQKQVRLHLAAFRQLPTEPLPAGVKAYSWLDPEEIPEFLRSMDVMFVLSRDEEEMRETFSQVMVQGMLSGLPIVCTPLPILTEKLDEGGGIIAGTPVEIAEALRTLTMSPSLREAMGRKAREVAEKRYVWNTNLFLRRFLPEIVVATAKR